MKPVIPQPPAWHAYLGAGIGFVSGLFAAWAMHAVTGGWVFFLVFPPMFAWTWYRQMRKDAGATSGALETLSTTKKNPAKPG